MGDPGHHRLEIGALCEPDRVVDRVCGANDVDGATAGLGQPFVDDVEEVGRFEAARARCLQQGAPGCGEPSCKRREPAVAGVVWNMADRGLIAAPHIGDYPYLEKPPGL